MSRKTTYIAALIVVAIAALTLASWSSIESELAWLKVHKLQDDDKEHDLSYIVWNHDEVEYLYQRIHDYGKYARSYPESRHISDAEDNIWFYVKSQNTISFYNRYLEYFPKSRYETESKVSIDKLKKNDNIFDVAINLNTKDALSKFIRLFPGHNKETVAKSLLDTFQSVDILEAITTSQVDIGKVTRVEQARQGLNYSSVTLSPRVTLKMRTVNAENESFVRTFAYPSGAAYGLLPDAWKPGWTRQMTAEDDLGILLSAVSGIKPATDVDRSAERYGGSELWKAEQEREAKQQAYIAELRARFVDGPVLILPRGRNASFITTGITPIPGEGTIYPNFRVSGEWGSITAGQVLMSPDGNTLTVPVPTSVDGDTLAGEDLTIFLEAGWVVIPGQRDGDFKVVQKEDQTESKMNEENKQTIESNILGLRTAIYNVGDLQAAKEWYTSAFQIEPYFDEPYYVGYNIGGFELGLLPDSTSAQDKSEGVVAYWGVDDIDSEYNRMIDSGAIAHEPPKNVGGEIIVATLKDPWGNVIGLIYNPEFKIGSE